MVFLFRLLARLPLSVLHNLGALLGWLVYACSPTYRQHLCENTALAGEWAVRARTAAIAEAGRSIAELPYIWLRPQAEVVAQVVRVSGEEFVEAARSNPRGMIFLTPHLGCFEIAGQYTATFGPLTVLYRPPRQAWLQPLVEQGRGANLKLAAADIGGVRNLMKALRRQENVGILPDQAPGRGEGVWVPFFGRPAYTMTLAARLAEGGATVLVVYAERLAYGAGYHYKVRPLAVPLAGTLEERAGQINRALEALIEECPAQYLWGYNRYKTPVGAAVQEAS